MARVIGPAVVALLVLVPAAQAKRCSQLRDDDLAPAKAAIVAEIPGEEGGTDLVSCILPRGAVHVMASQFDDDVNTSGYSIRQIRGEKVMFASSNGSQYGGGSATVVEDVRSERTYTILSQCYETLGGFCPGPPGAGGQVLVAASRLNALGQSAVILRSSSSVTVEGFSTQGARFELDSGTASDIPAGALRLRGSTVSWTHAGEPRTFTLTG